MQLVGDDLFTTNLERLERGIARRRGQRGARQDEPDRHAQRDAGAWSSARRRPATARSSRRARARPRTRRSPTSPSAPAGGQIKVGSVAQSERLAKYNQLLRIEEALAATTRRTRAARRSRCEDHPLRSPSVRVSEPGRDAVLARVRAADQGVSDGHDRLAPAELELVRLRTVVNPALVRASA